MILHFHFAFFLQLNERGLMFAAHPLITRHLLVHLLLHVLLLLLRNDAGRFDGGKIVGAMLGNGAHGLRGHMVDIVAAAAAGQIDQAKLIDRCRRCVRL